MSEPPLVSVVVACYNLARYLPEAVESVLTQTYPHVECIVVDDGSTDETPQVARGYESRGVRYARRDNGGISAARNTGIQIARGRYLKFLDADDHLAQEQIDFQVAQLAGREDAVAMSGVRLYRDGCPGQFTDHLPKAQALLPDLFKDIDWGGLMGFLIPAALVRKAGGFDEKLRVAEDWELLCRVGLLDPAFLPDHRVGCYYRQRAGSLSTRRREWATTQARVYLGLHDSLKASGRADWFGLELLKAEQGTYQALVQQGVEERPLLDGLLARIHELQGKVGFGSYGWRFRLMAKVLGYARAERLRAAVVRALKIRPEATLDTAEWRQNA